MFITHEDRSNRALWFTRAAGNAIIGNHVSHLENNLVNIAAKVNPYFEMAKFCREIFRERTINSRGVMDNAAFSVATRVNPDF
jgi:hypothetical protein